MDIKDIRQPISTNGGYWVEKFGESWKRQIDQVKAKFGSKIEDVRMPGAYPTDVPIIYVNKESLLELMRFLKEDQEFQYQFLADITATDEQTELRFEVVYQLFSHKSAQRIRVKTRVREDESVPSLVPVWIGADWAEREVYDMYGVKFEGHPNLRRILMDERWQGHPLRKDYPLRGYQIFTEPQQIDEKLLE